MKQSIGFPQGAEDLRKFYSFFQAYSVVLFVSYQHKGTKNLPSIFRA